MKYFPAFSAELVSTVITFMGALAFFQSFNLFPYFVIYKSAKRNYWLTRFRLNTNDGNINVVSLFDEMAKGSHKPWIFFNNKSLTFCLKINKNLFFCYF